MTSKSLALCFTLLLVTGSELRADSMHGVIWSWRRWDAGGGVINTPAPAPVAIPTAAPVQTSLNTVASNPTPTLFLTASPATSTASPSPVIAPAAPAVAAPAPAVPAPAPVPAAPATYDAVINLSSGHYNSSDILGGSTPGAWYQSPVVTNLYGGTPTAQQQADFSNLVLQRVNDTFHASGLNPNLTTDPNATSSHVLSVVSGASAPGSSSTIGLTDVGASGFTFVDKLGSATSIDQLATVIAKNVSHELMHAFGIDIHPDQTGTFIDSGTVSFDLLSNQASKFSDQAAQDILATNYGKIPFASTALGAQILASHPANCSCPSCVHARQTLAAQSVPEPATLVLWSVIAMGGLMVGKRVDRKVAA